MRTFAVQVGNLLEQSANGRREITAALRAEANCSITPQVAAARLASVADNRQSLLQQVLALNSPTPQARRIASLFQIALGHSRESNRHYRDWLHAGTSSGKSCALQPNEDYAAAQQEDALATRAKQQFLTAYNAVARNFGLRIWDENEI